ncbi:MAG: cyclomaltodextrinase N-terminal domain-containing protein, partial [Paludibacteraceae bacterium]|nr:cyclomaltodextrinase N-terminal domain-containing protein [Paludibacteraceae bacterium]
MKKTFSLFFALLLAGWLTAAPKIQQVEPLCWWTNMHTPLTLMFHGTDLADAQVNVQQVLNGKVMRGACLGLVPTGQHNAESPNYLFVDMQVNQPGTYRITLKKGNKKATYDYVIAERRAGSRERKSFTTADVVYLIMSDRFVDGDESNNSTKDTREKSDKNNVNGRFGGDIQGIINSFDHISKLGCTAIWPTPLLCDDEAAWSYHGYACSDY